MSDALRERINMQWREMRNGDYLRDLVSDAKNIIREQTPAKTATMVRNLTTATPVREGSQGLSAGLGDRKLVGYESLGAPRGTIKAFLRDYPEFRTRARVPEDKAWSYLSAEGKAVLQLEREGGKYGGSDQGVGVGKSAYFFQQEGSLDGWAGSAAKANITPTHFMSRAMSEWWNTSVPRVLKELARKVGWQ